MNSCPVLNVKQYHIKWSFCFFIALHLFQTLPFFSRDDRFPLEVRTLDRKLEALDVVLLFMFSPYVFKLINSFEFHKGSINNVLPIG